MGLVVVNVGSGIAFELFRPGKSVVVDEQPPDQPCFIQDVVSELGDVDFEVGDIVNVVVSSQPPNQPYFTHDVVGCSEFEVDVPVEVAVVDSSRQPIHCQLNH